MKTIQSKILFMIIAALVVITAIVSTIAVTITHQIIHKDADRILNNISQKEVAQVDDMLNDFVNSSAIMEHYASHELYDTELLKNDEYLSNYIKKIRLMFDEVALQTKGTTSYYFCLSPELTQNTTGFYIKFEENKNIYELSESQFSGLSLVTSDEIKEYSNFKGENNTSWVQPHPSRFTGETVISYITLLYRDDTFIGLLGFNMDFEYLMNRIEGISVYDYGCALLLSEDGTSYYNTPSKATIEDEYANSVTPLINGMSLELRAAYKDIQSGIRPMLTNIVYAFLVVLALAILYTVWVTHKIVTPLKVLTANARKLSLGEKEVSFVMDTKDEVGILSRTLGETYEKISEYYAYINALAYRDSLTGIKNSTAYAEAIEKLNKEINLETPSFGVLVADINNLKKTNDTFGHDIGNELIVHSSKILVDTFKTSSIFRIGGDEFVVILKGKDLEKYRTLLEKMDAAVASDFIFVNDETIPVSIARGVAVFDASIDHIYADVFTKADHAMYMNKEEVKSTRI